MTKKSHLLTSLNLLMILVGVMSGYFVIEDFYTTYPIYNHLTYIERWVIFIGKLVFIGIYIGLGLYLLRIKNYPKWLMAITPSAFLMSPSNLPGENPR